MQGFAGGSRSCHQSSRAPHPDRSHSDTRGDEEMNTFDWVEIRIRDAEKAARFYETVFGWRVINKETADGSVYWIFDTGGEPRTENLRRGALWVRGGEADLGTVVYIHVQDIEAVLRKVEERGGTVVLPRTAEDAAFRACFRDPDGNHFGLWQERRD